MNIMARLTLVLCVCVLALNIVYADQEAIELSENEKQRIIVDSLVPPLPDHVVRPQELVPNAITVAGILDCVVDGGRVRHAALHEEIVQDSIIDEDLQHSEQVILSGQVDEIKPLEVKKKPYIVLKDDIFADPEGTWSRPRRPCRVCGKEGPCGCHDKDSSSESECHDGCRPAKCPMEQIQAASSFFITAPNQHTGNVDASTNQSVCWSTDWLQAQGFQRALVFAVGGEPAASDAHVFDSIGYQDYRKRAPQPVAEKVQIYLGERKATSGTIDFQLPYSIPNGYYQYTVCAIHFLSGVVDDCSAGAQYACVNSPWIQVFHNAGDPGEQEYHELD